MVKYAPLAKKFISLAHNGVLSHVTTTKSLETIVMLNPNLASGVKDVEALCLELSQCLRTLLCWFREFKKTDKKKTILKGGTHAESMILHDAIAELVLRNADEDHPIESCSLPPHTSDLWILTDAPTRNTWFAKSSRR